MARQAMTTQPIRQGTTVLAEIGAHGVVADPDPSLPAQPSNAIKKALDREGLAVDQVDLFEINEPFAAVAIQSMRDLGIGSDIVNINGTNQALQGVSVQPQGTTPPATDGAPPDRKPGGRPRSPQNPHTTRASQRPTSTARASSR